MNVKKYIFIICMVFVNIFLLGILSANAAGGPAWWRYFDFQFAYIDKGNIKIKDTYDYFSKANGTDFIVKKNGKYGIVNGNGKYIVKPKYDLILYSDKNQYVVITVTSVDKYQISHGKVNVLVGVINNKGYFLLPQKYSYLDFAFGYYLVRSFENKTENKYVYELYDNNFKKINTFENSSKYPQIKTPSLIDFGYYDVDFQGNRIKEEIQSERKSRNVYVPEIVQAEKLKNLYNRITVKYNTANDRSSINYSREGHFLQAYKHDNEANMIGYYGAVNVDTKQDTKYVKAQKDNKWGIVDLNNKILIPFEYDEIYGFYSDAQLYVKQNDKWGVINSKNEWIIKPVLNQMPVFVKDNFIVLQNDCTSEYLNFRSLF